MALTVLGLKKVKTAIMKSADANDPELNKVLQECVRGINRLLDARSGLTAEQKKVRSIKS